MTPIPAGWKPIESAPKGGTPHSHYDICLKKRAHAVAAGAVEIGRQELAALIQRKRAAQATTKERT